MKRKLSLILVVMYLLVWIGITPAFAAPSNSIETPKTGEELRALTVDYARKLSEVVWYCDKSVDFSKAVTWSPNLVYLKGTEYHGLPYTSDKIAGNASLDEFISQCDDNGTYVGPTSWNDMPGSDCGGQVRLAYGYAGVLENFELENLMFNPGDECFASGMKPLGGYDYSQFSYSKATARSIMEVNGEAKMFDCFSLLRAGDSLFVVYGDGGEHIMLVTGDPVIVKDENGKYVPEECKVPVLELNSAVHDKGSYKSNWNDLPYTFRQLFDTGFIPYTMETFEKKSVDEPEVSAENISISGEVGFHNLMSGRVVSNYNIFALIATVTDSSGKTVADGVSYPLSLNADLSELDYSAELTKLPAGDYHYTLTAQLGYGKVTVTDTDIHYTGGKEKPVVYISDNGTGNGESADSPLGNASGYETVTMVSYRNSAFVRAMEMLSETGGTVVVCGDVTLSSGRSLTRYTTLLSPLATPALVSKQSVELTSVFDGVDYREKNGAELIMQRSATQAVDLELNIGTTWKDLDFRVDYNYNVLPPITMSTIKAFISFGGQKTVIEPSVRVSLSLAGDSIDSDANSKYFPNVYGSYYSLTSEGNTDVTVLGGNWGTVVGGSYAGYLVGSCSVTVGDKAVLYDGIVGGNSGNAAICGDVNVKITGGTISGKLVAGSAGNFAVDEYNVLLQIQGDPDLSGVRIINAGADSFAKSVVLDLSKFRAKNTESFTAYYNADDFTQVKLPGGLDPMVIVIAAAAGVLVLAAAVIIIVLIKKKKRAA